MLRCLVVPAATAREVAQGEMRQHKIRIEIQGALEGASRLIRAAVFEQDNRTQVVAGGVQLVGSDPPIAPGEGIDQPALIGQRARQQRTRAWLRRVLYTP